MRDYQSMNHATSGVGESEEVITVSRTSVDVNEPQQKKLLNKRILYSMIQKFIQQDRDMLPF